MGYKLLNLDNFETNYVSTIYSLILGGGVDSNLFKTVREKNSLCYSISSNIYKVSNIMFITAGLFRPDIGGEDNITCFEYTKDECEVEEVELEVLDYVIDTWGKRWFKKVDDKKWDHMESKKYNDKKCDHYYNDDEKESIYVYDDHIYVITGENYDLIFDYKWKAPMEDFVLAEEDYPKCFKEKRKVAEIPSEDYIMCAASSTKIAFIAITVALIAALF